MGKGQGGKGDKEVSLFPFALCLCAFVVLIISLPQLQRRKAEQRE